MINISGIKGEYRRPNPSEIAIIVKTFRRAQGLKQAALAASSGVTTRTLERLEGSIPVSAETYRRVAMGLGLERGAFIDARYISTPEEALERVERQLSELEKTHIRVPVARATDPRQILRLLDPDALIFDDSKIKLEHLDMAIELKQMLLDLRDIAPDLDEPGKLGAAKDALDSVKRLEALGYVVTVGIAGTYQVSGGSNWPMAVVNVFPRPSRGRAPLPSEVLLKTGLSLG